MPEASYAVETVLTIRDQASSAVAQLGKVADKASKGIDKAKDAAEKAQPKFTSLGGAFQGVAEQGQSLRGVLFELAAAAGIATTLRGAFQKFIDTNAEAETATRSLGASLSGLYQYGNLDPVANLHESLRRAGERMDYLNAVAFDTGIPMSALAATVKTLAPSVAAAGGSTEKLTTLTSDLAKLSRGLGLGYEESASQIAMAVKFGRIRPGSGILAQLDISKKQFENMSKAARLAHVISKIKLMRPDSVAEIKTYTDLVGVVRERVDQIAEAAGKPLFNKAKKLVEELGDWLKKNRVQIQKTAELLADKFVAALDAAVATVRLIYENWDKVKAIVIAVAGVMVAHRAAGWVKEFGSSIADVTRRIAEMHAVKLGQQFGDAAAPGLEGVGAKAGTGIGKAAAAGMILEAALIGVAIGTAINSWLMKQPWWDKAMTPAKNKAEEAQDRLQEAELNRGRVAVTALLAAAKYQKEHVQSEDEKRAIKAGVYKALKPVSEMEYLTALKEKVLAGKGTGVYGYAGQKEGMFQARLGDITDAMKALSPPAMAAKVEALKAPDERVKQPEMNFPNARFDITQNFAEGFDPDRIAVAFTEDLARLGEHKVQSSFAPAFSAAG